MILDNGLLFWATMYKKRKQVIENIINVGHSLRLQFSTIYAYGRTVLSVTPTHSANTRDRIGLFNIS